MFLAMVTLSLAGVRLAVSGAGASGMVEMRVLSPGLAPGPAVSILLGWLLPQAARAATAATAKTRDNVPIPKGMLKLPMHWNPHRQCPASGEVPARPAYLTSPIAVDSLGGN